MAHWVKLLEVPAHREFATVRQLRRMTSDGRIGFTKFGGHVLIDLDELDALVERGRVDRAEPVTLRSLRPVARKRAS